MKIEKTDKLNESPLFATCKKAQIKGSTLTVSVSCTTAGKKWKGLVLSYDNKVEEDKADYLIKASTVKKGKKNTILNVSVDLARFPFRTTNWNVLAYYEEDGEPYSVKIQYRQPKPSLLSFLKSDGSYRTRDGYMAFCVALRGGYFGIRYREVSRYDGRFTRFKESLATIWYRLHKEAYKRRKIYLIYEKRCQKASDNGYYLFKYIMDNDMEKYLNAEVYYVLEKGSVDAKKVAAYSGHVLQFMSLKFMLMFMAANLIISPDSRTHSYIWLNNNNLLAPYIKKKKHVFLGHGVLAFKRLNESFSANSMKSVLCTVTSEKEADIVCNEMGFARDRTAITGYARFDALRDTSGDSRDILVMPTHRSWLFGVERNVFTDSEYFSRYMELLNSEKISDLLEKNDARMFFYVHPSIMEHRDAFSTTSDRIEVVPYGKYSIDDLLMSCRMLITDYSSVAWDMYYMDKPIIFYQYDVDKYLDTWGSYVDLEKDMPGDRACDFDSLVDLTEQYIKTDFRMKPEFEAVRKDSFAYLDNNNCRRICEALKKRNY